MKIMLISDFDGTISKKDFFEHAIDHLLSKEDIAPWQEYLSKKTTHIEALKRIFEKIKIKEKEFHDFVLTLPIEEKFIDTVKLAKSKGIPYCIVSAGAEWYIKLILQELGVYDDVSLISNPSTYSQKDGLVMRPFGEDHPYYSKNLGVSKEKIVEKYKNEGYFCIYIGDGRPDFEAAKKSDIVFARGMLLELCKKERIETKPFNSYQDVYDYIENV